MWQTNDVGRFHLTIDAEPSTGRTATDSSSLKLDRLRELHDATRELIDLLAEFDLAATWAVGDPAHSALTAVVAKSLKSHEMALLGDSHWMGRTAGRKRFARELSRRVTQARAAGIDLVTLAPRVAPAEEHFDLVVKHGIRMIVGTDVAASSRGGAITPRIVHYGVWGMSASLRLPLRRAWFPGVVPKQVRMLRRAAAKASAVHWIVHVAAVAEQGRAGMKTITGLLQKVAQLRDESAVQVETLRDVVARLSVLPAARPQHSILRAAA
jgi:hypothetical protein